MTAEATTAPAFRDALAQIVSLLSGGSTISPDLLSPERVQQAVEEVAAYVHGRRSDGLSLCADLLERASAHAARHRQQHPTAPLPALTLTTIEHRAALIAQSERPAYFLMDAGPRVTHIHTAFGHVPVTVTEDPVAERLRLHEQRPAAYVPEGVGVSLPLPTGPERLDQIKARLSAACFFPDPTGEIGWQVYAQSTVSTGKMEALLRGRDFIAPTEYTIHTAHAHGQLKGPAPIVSRMGGPYHYPNDLSALTPEHATFIGHAPADIAYLLEQLEAYES